MKPRHVGDLLVARVAEHRVAAADQHRHVGDRDVEPIEQRLDVRIAIEIDVGVRVAVARQELLDAQRARRVRRSDEHDVAEAARDQLHPAQDEGAHQDLAELGVGLHERQQLVAIQLDHLARFAHAARKSAGRPEIMLASPVNWPGSWTTIDRFAGARRTDDLDLPGRHDEERHDLVARVHEHFARADLAYTTVRRNARDLLGRQGRGRRARRAPAGLGATTWGQA